MAFDFQSIYNNNIKYFKTSNVGAFKAIDNADISMFELNLDNNDINVKVNGHILYPSNVQEAIKGQVNSFIENPTIFYKNPTYHDINKIPNEYLHTKYLFDIENNSPFKLEDRVNFKGYKNGLDNSLPLVLAFGVGLGIHIIELIKKVDVKNLIIIDSDYSFLKLSMHIVDWEYISKYFSRPGYSLKFQVSQEPELLARSVINELYVHYPFYTPYLPYFMHYETDFYDRFIEEFKKNVKQSVTGLGFYDDEIMSLKHTLDHLNCKPPIPIYKGGKKLPKDSVAFLIASGPSLDNDIEFIKKNQDKVVIFSAGTGLSSLLANDIIPDFHVEKERIQGKVRGVDKLGLKQEHLDKITFLGVNVIHQDVFDRFKNKAMFFRSNDTGGSILSNIPKLTNCMPTATNAALSIISHMQFDQVYMFGTDVGYWDVKNHHSKSSAYYDKSSPEHFNFVHPKTTTKIKSNFRDEDILTNDGMYWCKLGMENCLESYKNYPIQHINCSDGAYITNAIPKKSSDINLTFVNKKEILFSLEDNFISEKHEIKSLINNSKKLLSKYKKVYIKNVDKIINIISNSKINSYSNMFELMTKTYNIIVESGKTQESLLAYTFLKGSLYHFYIVIYSHSLAVTKENAIKYINESFLKIIKFLEEIKKDIDNIILTYNKQI